MDKQKKGVRLENISKIYTDPKTGKEFYAVQDTTLDIEPGSFVTLLGLSLIHIYTTYEDSLRNGVMKYGAMACVAIWLGFFALSYFFSRWAVKPVERCV